MTHQYRQRILVMLRENGEPGSLIWRGVIYPVAEVLARWHLRDRWWEGHGREGHGQDPAVSVGDASSPCLASDRHYYRLRCVDGLLCEVYWDAAAGDWTLDRVLD